LKLGEKAPVPRSIAGESRLLGGKLQLEARRAENRGRRPTAGVEFLGRGGAVPQWRSQALKSGWASPAGSIAGPPVEVWGRSPQKPDIYKHFSAVDQMLFYAGLLSSPSSIAPTPKKLRICMNPMTQHGHGRARAHPWLRYCPSPPARCLGSAVSSLPAEKEYGAF